MASPQITVDASGIAAPSYQEWLSYLQETYRSIYGADIYIEADSQDGQLLAVLAQALYDTGSSCVAVYNSFSPSTAQGAGLSSVVKTNGIRRQRATNSTAVVTITGQAGTVITNGVIGDSLSLGTRWSIPTTVIPPDGDIDVTATSQVEGAITAGAGSLSVIMTPQPGWQTVTNAAAAVPGDPVETDAELRQRQSRSAALPADTTLNGIYSAVADVSGVQRAEVYQNDTNLVDANGLPGNSIAVVVQGGNSGDVAAAIALKKPPGINMEGNTTVTVVDSRGVPDTIKYYPLRLVGLHALIFLTTLTGYASSTADLIKSALAQCANDQSIGEDVYLTRVFSPANLIGESAQAATGMTQAQLDVLGRTYHITEMAIGDDDMVTVGTAVAGAVDITVVSSVDFSIGDVVFITLDDNSQHRVVLSNVVVGGLTFSPAIPVGRTAPDSAQVYVVGDISMNFAEAASGSSADVVIEVS